MSKCFEDAQRDQRDDALTVRRDLVKRVSPAVGADRADPVDVVFGEVGGEHGAAVRHRMRLHCHGELAPVERFAVGCRDLLQRRRAGSYAISFVESTGAQGTSNLRRMSTASYLVLSASHFSMSSKMSKMCDSRALAVFYAGSSIHSGLSMASQVRSQFCSWMVK